MTEDLLTEKAIILRDILTKLEDMLLQSHYTPSFEDKHLLKLLDHACKACVALGDQYIQTESSSSVKHPPQIFQKLVEADVIDTALSKRLLSFIAFRRLIREAHLLRGKNFHLKITYRQLEDFHTFTQKVLLA